MEEKIQNLANQFGEWTRATRLLQLQVGRLETLLEKLLDMKYGTHVGANPEPTNQESLLAYLQNRR